LAGKDDNAVRQARVLCEQLQREFEEVTLETKRGNSRLLPLAYAWANQVHRYVGAALVLLDRGFAHEALVLQRQAVEFTVRLHWLVKVGDSAVDTVVADHQRSLSTLAVDAAGGPLGLPQEFLDEWSGSAADDVYAFGSFREACEAFGLTDSLYTLYRHLSQFAHPTWGAAITYLHDRGKDEVVGVRVEPKPAWENAPLMLARLLVWSARDLDDLLIGKPRRRRLQQAARTLESRPVLPYLRGQPRKRRTNT
jgi:hypothetical protein